MKTTQELLDIYRKTYKHINEETLNKAAIEKPDILLELLESDGLKRLTVGYILLALSNTLDVNYLSVIKSYLNHVDNLIREAAYMAISQYYDDEIDNELNKEVLTILKTGYENEYQEPVKRKIESILDYINLMTY